MDILDEVFSVIEERKRNPTPESYVAGLLASGRAPEKVIEEAEELIKAAEEGKREEIVHEAADLIFHAMVLMAEKGVTLADVKEELRRRRR